MAMLDQADATLLGLAFKARIQDTLCSPLCFFVHGRNGNYDVMWCFRSTLPTNWSIIAPQAPLRDEMGGWSWWQINDSIEIQRENIVKASNILYKFMLTAIEYYQLSPSCIVCMGFSQGGIISSVVLQSFPEILDGLVLLCSRTIQKDRCPDLTGKRVFIGHGNLDPVISIDEALKSHDYLARQRADVTLSTDDTAHKISSRVIKELKQWFQSF